MKNNTHIVVLLDRSGSMKNIKQDTIGGMNQFFDEQKKVAGEASLTLIQFDDKYEINYSQKKIQEIEHLNDETFKPRGWTRLHDAMGKSIISTGEDLKSIKEEDRPDKIVFVVMTDGRENDSKEFKQGEIANLVKEQSEKYKWQFVFLGANQNAILEAQKIGIQVTNAMTYAANTKGVSSSLKSLTSNLRSYREGGADSMAFSEKQREEQQEAGLGHPMSNLKPTKKGFFPAARV